MKNKGLLAAVCLIAGIPLAAYGLAGGGAWFALAGLLLVFAFWYLAWQWVAKAGKPQTPIKPAPNAAWAMRDQAPGSVAPAPFAAPAPGPSAADGGGEGNGGAARRGGA
jgi:hypothetical protein